MLGCVQKPRRRSHVSSLQAVVDFLKEISGKFVFDVQLCVTRQLYGIRTRNPKTRKQFRKRQPYDVIQRYETSLAAARGQLDESWRVLCRDVNDGEPLSPPLGLQNDDEIQLPDVEKRSRAIRLDE